MSLEQLEREIDNGRPSYAVNYPDAASAWQFVKDNQGDTCHSHTVVEQMTIDVKLIDMYKDVPF